MSAANRLLSILISLAATFFIVELVRRGRLKEKYALLWIFAGIGIFIFGVSEKALYWFANLFGIKTPINAVLFFGLIFILAITLHFSLAISKITEQNKKMGQKLALLEEHFRIILKKKS